ncbi:MAG: KOW motif-containing protein [Bdellovibrionales bacterium]
MKLKIKKNATVEVISGAEKGKKGTVVAIDTKGMRIKVQGVKVMTHYDRKDGLLKKEGFISYSNVKLVEQAAPKKAEKAEKAKKAKSKSA